MREPLTYFEYRQKLKEKHPDKDIYPKRWDNYPNSVFFYDTPNFDGTTDNIGIYMSETVYCLEPC